MGTTSVVVVACAARVSATAAATGAQDDDGDARQSVAWLRSTRVQNEAKPRSPAGRSCTPGVPSSLLSSSSLRTTTRTIFFHRSTIRGRVGSWRLRSRLTALERASLFVREEKSEISVCMRVYAIEHISWYI